MKNKCLINIKIERKMDSTKNEEKLDFKFQVISDKELSCAYSAGCSGGRSECCTRVCTRLAQPANVEQWGRFLAINAGVIQY
jgi:hypothetical protein